MVGTEERETFTRFVREVEPRLRRALIGARGPDVGRDAVAEALAYAWEHWHDVQQMANPAGYLYRVGQSRTRSRRRPVLPPAEPSRLPEVEPGLHDALARLSEKQRAAIWLVHACGWSYADTAEAIDSSVTAVGTHLTRGMNRLRDELGAHVDA